MRTLEPNKKIISVVMLLIQPLKKMNYAMNFHSAELLKISSK